MLFGLFLHTLQAPLNMNVPHQFLFQYKWHPSYLKFLLSLSVHHPQTVTEKKKKKKIRSNW